MTARRAISHQNSRISNQSQISAVLDTNSIITSDEEGDPLWFQHLERNSINVRASARFSLARNETAVLEADSEIESTPMRNTWWDALDNTPDIRHRKSIASQEKSNVSEQSNLESSNTSSVDDVVAKRRVALRQNKRKSLQRNVFTKILDSPKASSSSEKNSHNQNEEKQVTANVAESDTDESIEKVRKLPLKKKRTTRKSSNVFQKVLDASQSSNNSPHRTAAVKEPERTVQNQNDSIAVSSKSRETIRIEHEVPPSKNRSTASNVPQMSYNQNEDQQVTADVSESDTDKSIEKIKKLPLKQKRTIRKLSDVFQKVLDASQSSNNSPHRTAAVKEPQRTVQNQNDSLAVSSKSTEKIRIEHEVPLSKNRSIASDFQRISFNQNKDQQITADVSESDTDKSIEKIRKLPVKKKRTTRKSSDVFQRVLDASQSSNNSQHQTTAAKEPEHTLQNQNNSLSISTKSTEPIRIERGVPLLKDRSIPSNETAGDVLSDDHLEISHSPVLVPRPKKRTVFTKSLQRRTPNFDELLNNESKENDTTDQVSNREDMKLNQNQRLNESITQLSLVSDLQSDILDHEDESGTRDGILKQRVPISRTKRNHHQGKMSEQHLEISKNTSIQSEPVTVRKQIGEFGSSQQAIPWSDNMERTLKRKNDPLATSGASSLEVENIQSAKKLRYLPSAANKSLTERRSMNKTNDRIETSVPSDIELTENDSLSTPSQHSSNGNKSRIERDSVINDNYPAEVSHKSSSGLEDTRSVSILASGSSNNSAPGRPSLNKENEFLVNSSSSDIELEKAESMNRSSVSNKSNNPKQSVDRTDLQGSRYSNIELEENQLMNITTRPSTTRNEFGAEILLMNKQKYGAGISRSLDIEMEANQSVDIPFLQSTSSQKPCDPNHNKNSNQSQQPNTSRRISRKSMINEFMESSDEEENEEELSRTDQNLPSTPGLIDQTEKSPEYSKNSRAWPPDGRTSSSESMSTVEQDETPFRDGSQGVNVEKLLQIKHALDEVSKKELSGMKSRRIDSYFTRIPITKPDHANNNLLNVTSKTKSGIKKGRTAARPVNKAYLVNGIRYKRPNLPRPKQWATDRLYNYLQKKLEPKYKLNVRKRSAKFIVDLSNVVTLVSRRKKYSAYKEHLDSLIHEMARLEIITTRYDFEIFCREFLPYEFRSKVIPMTLPGNIKNIPFDPDKVHTPILEL